MDAAAVARSRDGAVRCIRVELKTTFAELAEFGARCSSLNQEDAAASAAAA